jgi:predicted nucleic acid-binding protein
MGTHKNTQRPKTRRNKTSNTRLDRNIRQNGGILSTREITEETTNIALTQNTTIYDALYIAATQKLNATLYTADQKLHNIANKITNTKLLRPRP